MVCRAQQEIDAMDDIRVLILSRAQGPYGLQTARRYANELMEKGARAFGQGNTCEAIAMAARELDFNCRAFGSNHPYTMCSKYCLAALQRRSDVRIQSGDE